MSSYDQSTKAAETQIQQQKGPEAFLSQQEREMLQRLLKFPEEIPKEHKEWITDYIAVNGLELPIGQVRGLTKWMDDHTVRVWQAEVAGGLQGTTSATYTDLSTAGPSLTGMPDGSYIIIHGAYYEGDADVRGAMALSINGGAASDTDATQAGVDGLSGDQVRMSISTANAKTLSNAGSNSITAKYRRIAGTTSSAAFNDRFIIAMRTGP